MICMKKPSDLQQSGNEYYESRVRTRTTLPISVATALADRKPSPPNANHESILLVKMDYVFAYYWYDSLRRV